MKPPRLSRRLLEWILPASYRAEAMADLDEEFTRHIAPSRSRRRAARWYRRQAVKSAVASLVWRGRGIRAARHPLAGLAAGVAEDVRHGWRRLVRQPAFTLAVVVTLGLGVAVASAVTTIAHAVLIRSLPYGDPGALVVLSERDPARPDGSGNLSYPDLLEYRATIRSLTSIAAFNGASRFLKGAGQPDQVSISEVTANFFDTLGVKPARGRSFREDDGRSNAPAVAILTDGAWHRRFGAAPDIVGRVVTLGGEPATIVGVLPADFEFPLKGLAEVWTPIRPTPAHLERSYYHWLDVVARLAPSTTIDQARAEIAAAARGRATTDPRWHPSVSLDVTPLVDRMVGDVRPMLLALVAAAAFLLFAASANVAGLLLARSAARSGEIDLRMALGASRSRIARLLLIECAVLALPAAVFGTVIGQGLVQLFVASMPVAQRLAVPHLDRLRLEPALVGWSLLIAVTVTLIAGLAPAWRAADRAHGTSVRTTVGGTRRERRWQTGFLIAQVALACILCSGAVLMASSVRRLMSVSLGFSTDGLIAMRTAVAGSRYTSAEIVAATHDEIVTKIASIPRVTGVATVSQSPLSGPGNSGTFTIDGEPGREVSVRIRTVTANYFDLMGIPQRRGRPLLEADRADRPRVVLVNDTLASRVFGGDAVGRRISFPFVQHQPFWEIVGVVGDEQLASMDREMVPIVYFPYGQSGGASFSLTLRSDAEPASIIRQARAAVASIDSDLPLFLVQTSAEMVGGLTAVFRRRSVLGLVAAFAIGAIALAAVGLFGMVAQAVSQRTREIGVRLTLGATAADVRRRFLAVGLVPAAVGLVAGLFGAAIFGQALRGVLFGVTPVEPALMLLSALLLGVIAVAACLLAAARAGRIDPADALRPSPTSRRA